MAAPDKPDRRVEQPAANPRGQPTPADPELVGAGAARREESGATAAYADEPTRVAGSAPTTLGGVDASAFADVARIEGYQLHEELHRGGQGIVFRATQLGTKQQVALKVLLEGPFAGEAARRRFEREVELAASLRHPNIVTILDSGISHGRYFFAMEFIDGVRLDHYVRDRKPPLRELLALLEQVCAAVNFAHQRGVIHRDLKPSNILVDADGRPHVLDFGLAKPTQRVESEETVQMLSTTGQLLGTLGYMSPEQAAGAHDIDIRSDVYSLGVIAYEAVLGAPPYSVTGALGEVLNRIAHDEPQHPRSIRGRSPYAREIDDEIATILLKALEKDPAQRYQSAADFGRDLRRYLHGQPIEAKRASGFYVFRKTLRRYRLQAGLAAAVLVMLIIFTIVLAISYAEESRARGEAEVARKEASRQAEIAQKEAERAERQARIAGDAESQERLARAAAERNAQSATLAALSARRSLVRQKIQRGEFARRQGDLSAARDSFWDAYDDADGFYLPLGSAAKWALRQYYAESGDVGAAVLLLEQHGPMALSRSGQLAAVCDAPDAISVCDTQTAENLGWVRTPAPVSTVHVEDDGRLLAGGRGWARVWLPDSFRPRSALELPEDFVPRAVRLTGNAEWIVVAGETQGETAARVYTYSANDGRFAFRLALQGALTAPPDVHPAEDLFAFSTTRGWELVRVDVDGRSDRLAEWLAPDGDARAVRFTSDGALLMLGRSLSVVTRADGTYGPDPRILGALEATWDFIDAGRLDEPIVLGARDGRVGVFDGRRLDRTWRMSLGALEAVRLLPDRGTVISLDRRGLVTRWRDPQSAPGRKILTNRPVSDWAVSADGSTLLLASPDGGVLTYRPDVAPEPLRLTRTLRLSAPDARLTLSGNGKLAGALDGNRIHIFDLQGRRQATLRWSYPDVGNLSSLVLSGDGKLLACHAKSENGELQKISFHRLDSIPEHGGITAVAQALPLAGTPIELVGNVRQILFHPHRDQLFVAGSNGELTVLAPDGPVGADLEAVSATVVPWTVLDASPQLMAFDRSGERLAVACDDGVVRLLSTRDASRTGQIVTGQRVVWMSFDARSDLLMVQTPDARLTFYELETREPVAHWQLATEARQASAEGTWMPGAAAPADARADQPVHPTAWIGNDGAFVLGADEQVVEQTLESVDAVIESNRKYARQRDVLRQIANGDFDAAWLESEDLRDADARLGQSMQEHIVELLLRRPGPMIPLEWADALLAEQNPRAFFRLGHAAYDAGRFDFAGQWLTGGAELVGDDLDAYTLWRIASCEYLAGNGQRAADLLAGLGGRPDFDALDLPQSELELTASLLLVGDLRRAETTAQRVGSSPRNRQRPAETFARRTPGVIAQNIVQNPGDTSYAAGLETLFSTLAEPMQRYRDDTYFFAGERALRAGQRSEAIAQYQRCINVARDEWPSNWARYRLSTIKSGEITEIGRRNPRQSG